MADNKASLIKKGSKMYKTKKESIKYIEDSVKLLNEKRNKGDMTDYVRDNKDEGKKFDFFRYIKKKHTKTGRFGAEKAKERNDSISLLDTEGEKTRESYFDPFAMKLIIPEKEDDEVEGDQTNTDIEQDIENEENEDEVSGAEQENGTTGAQDANDSGPLNDIEGNTSRDRGVGFQRILIDDFIARVDEQIELAKRNDFEKHRAGMKSRLALAEGLTKEKKEMKKENEDNYDAGKAFQSDIELKEEVPDSFAVRIGVAGPPKKYSQEFTQFEAKETKGMWAKIKGLFFKKPSEEEIFKKFAKTVPEYKQIMNMGKAEAAEAGMKYNEAEDPNMQLFLAQLKAELMEKNGTGHTGVKMIAKKGGEHLSEYSFGFVTPVESGMAGAVTGLVMNPDPAASSQTYNEEEISHSNYLRAAAKIRGTVGSMRTYSTIGYNCTSFAMEIAQTAGMKIKDEASSSYIMTHRHRSQRVDTPYTLARSLKKDNKVDFTHYVPLNELKFMGKSDEEKVNPKKLDATKKELEPMLLALPAVVEISKYNPKIKEDLMAEFNELILKTLAEAAEIDYLYPVLNLKGEQLAEAQKTRADKRIEKFGTASEQEYLAGLLKDENKVFEMLLNMKLDIESLGETEIWGDETQTLIRGGGVQKMVDSKFMEKFYPGIGLVEKMRIANNLLPQIWNAQNAIKEKNRKELKGLKGADLVKAIVERAKEYGGAQLLGYDIFDRVSFDDADAVKKFLDFHNIPLPQAKESPKEEKVEESPDLDVPKAISKDDMEKMVDDLKDVAVKIFLDVFSEPYKIEGRLGRYTMEAYNVARILNRAKNNKVAFGPMAVLYAKIKMEKDRKIKEELLKKLFMVVLNKVPRGKFENMLQRENIT